MATVKWRKRRENEGRQEDAAGVKCHRHTTPAPRTHHKQLASCIFYTLSVVAWRDLSTNRGVAA